MDRYAGLPEMQHSINESLSIRTLGLTKVLPIDPAKVGDGYLDALWNILKDQGKVFDDFSKDDAPAFAAMLASPYILHFEAGNGRAYICVKDLVVTCNPHIHFVIWDNMPMRDVLAAAEEIITFVFKQFKKTSRISAYIPLYVEKSMKFATLLGFKFEGEQRNAILYHGQYHTVKFYGLLRDEWTKRQQVRSQHAGRNAIN